MIIIDDRDYTFTPNLNNGVLIPAYQPEDDAGRSIDSKKIHMRKNDRRLLELMEWFESNEFKAECDIRKMDKSKIFA